MFDIFFIVRFKNQKKHSVLKNVLKYGVRKNILCKVCINFKASKEIRSWSTFFSKNNVFLDLYQAAKTAVFTLFLSSVKHNIMYK